MAQYFDIVKEYFKREFMVVAINIQNRVLNNKFFHQLNLIVFSKTIKILIIT